MSTSKEPANPIQNPMEFPEKYLRVKGSALPNTRKDYSLHGQYPKEPTLLNIKEDHDPDRSRS